MSTTALNNKNFSDSLLSGAHSMIRLLQTWMDRHYQRKQLEKLDPRMLEDIGLDRSWAMNEVRKPFWK